MTSAVILGMIVTMFPEPREQAKAIGVYAFVASAGGSVGPARGRRDHPVDRLALDLLHQRADRRSPPRWLARRLLAAERASAFGAGADVPGARADHRVADGRRLHDRRPGRRTTAGATRARSALGARLARAAGGVPRARGDAPQPAGAAADLPLAHLVAANPIQILSVAGMFGMFFLGALYLRRVLGYDALQIGLAFLPVTIAMGTLSIRYSERLVTRFGARRTLLAGLPLIMASLALFALAPVHGELPDRRAALDGAARDRRGRLLPGADGRGDVRSDAAGRRPRLGPRQHHRAGRRGARAGRAGDALGVTHARTLSARALDQAAALTAGYHLAFWIAAGARRVRDRRVAVDAARAARPLAGCGQASRRGAKASATGALPRSARASATRPP